MAVVSLEQAVANGNYAEDESARKAIRAAIAHFKEIK